MGFVYSAECTRNAIKGEREGGGEAADLPCCGMGMNELMGLLNE